MKRHAAGYLWTTLLPWLLIGSTVTLAGCSSIACASRAFREKPAETLAPAPPEKPSILLKVTPQVSHAPATVRLTILVNDPGGVLHCPSFRILMGDGNESGREQSCPPSDPVQEGYALNVKPHTYRVPGVYVVEVRVLVAGKVVLSESTRVLVVGQDEDENYSAAAL